MRVDDVAGNVYEALVTGAAGAQRWAGTRRGSISVERDRAGQKMHKASFNTFAYPLVMEVNGIYDVASNICQALGGRHVLAFFPSFLDLSSIDDVASNV